MKPQTESNCSLIMFLRVVLLLQPVQLPWVWIILESMEPLISTDQLTTECIPALIMRTVVEWH